MITELTKFGKVIKCISFLYVENDTLVVLRQDRYMRRKGNCIILINIKKARFRH
jgi:hypothetical protein